MKNCRTSECTKPAVLIADDHGLYRAGLGLLLRDHFDFGEILEAASFDAALDSLASHKNISLALFDLKMPGIGGPETLGVIRETFPDIRIAIISALEERDSIMRALASGLFGYILKSSAEAEIIKAIRMIESGAVYVPNLITRVSTGPVGHLEKSSSIPQPSATEPHEQSSIMSSQSEAGSSVKITARQNDVLKGIQRGLSNKEIARELGISDGTVKIHLPALFDHFGARNRVDLLIRSRL